jgi:hypothetical protein
MLRRKQRKSHPASTIAESLHNVWLFAIADAKWRPAAGERVTVRFERRLDDTDVIVVHERIADQRTRDVHGGAGGTRPEDGPC